MQKSFSLRLKPTEAASESIISDYIASAAGVKPEVISGFHIIKKSIDARSRQPWINLTVLAFINEPFYRREILSPELKDVSRANKKVIIVGAGPAGLFAAIRLIEAGIKPVVLERGKDVRSRRRDLAAMNKEGIVNPDSNYCFGEGGAGTYSDGKLYTRSKKRGDINRILNLMVKFGAPENILYDAHPHIGTNKLPHIITAMRETITAHGGEFLFRQKLESFQITEGRITGVTTSSGDKFDGDAVILATGHSARDIFQMLHRRNIIIEAKPFALGVRIEHPQALIDQVQYHCTVRDPLLPPASYSLVEQVNKKGVFSFCMCPGGIIAPASTFPGEIVVNGWSPSKRNNPYANSGMVVTVEAPDYMKIDNNSPLAAMYFQQMVEQKAFEAGGGGLTAPAQRMVDFAERKFSSTLPDCSYLPGINSARLDNVLPDFVYTGLSEAFKSFGRKMKGYFTNEAIVLATESRTSSPVRIPRDPETLQHPQICNLYPCGEGAGYAGGIVSAAMDGEKVADAVIYTLSR